MFALLQRPQAARQLRRLRKTHHSLIEQIQKAITGLAANPRPPGAKRLVNRAEWRIRVSDFRILYEIEDVGQTVTIAPIANRRDVYKQK